MVALSVVEVRDKLFARSFNNSGLDLPAVNNQRGREHGKWEELIAFITVWQKS